MSEPDELFVLRNMFYLGNYQGAIKEVSQIKVSDESKKVERDCFLYRSYIAQQKYAPVINEITDSSPPAFKAIKQLAIYIQSASKRQQAVNDLKTLLIASPQPIVALMTATVFLHEGNYEEALRSVHNFSDLECQALQIQTLLKINRVDLAKKQLTVMKGTEEDATLTQLTEAWVNLSTGGEKIQDAFYIFQELAEKNSVTVKLLNNQAICHMLLNKFEEAEDLLKEAYERNNNDPETLANVIVVGRQLNKSEEAVNRILSQLKEVDPNHPFVQNLVKAEAFFDSSSQNFRVSKQ